MSVWSWVAIAAFSIAVISATLFLLSITRSDDSRWRRR